MTSFPEMMFYAEAEGLLPTRTGKINAIINWLKSQSGDKILALDFYNLCDDYDLNDLSAKEQKYIESESGVDIVIY